MRFALLLVAFVGLLLVTLHALSWVTLGNPDAVVYASLASFVASFVPWER